VTYVVAHTFQSYRFACKQAKIDYKDQKIIFVKDVNTLLGRRYTPGDKIIWAHDWRETEHYFLIVQMFITMGFKELE